jgi:tetratricopeptide (TPR) repeat protein
MDEAGTGPGYGGNVPVTAVPTLGPRLPLAHGNGNLGDWGVGRDLREKDVQEILPTSEAASRHTIVTGRERTDILAGEESGGTLGRLVTDDDVGDGLGYGGNIYLQHFTHPGDGGFDDLTAFAPGLSADLADAWRERLGLDAEHAGPHAIDAAARDLLARARRELPSGIYRWGDLEIAVDVSHHLGWKRTTDDGLGETASFDGKTWLRRYGELAIDATRAVGDDDIALALGYLPMWIAEPEHYTRWFDVTARGREIVLSRAVHGKAAPVLVLVFDDRARLVAVRDAHGTKLIEITWSAGGPSAAQATGEPIAAGFTAAAIADAGVWAHGASQPGLAVELPLHIPSYWEARVAAEVAGTPAWRHAQRQWMASLAAVDSRGELLAAYQKLRDHGGVELGDIALASSALVTAPGKDLGPELAAMAKQPLVAYVAASHAYHQVDRVAAPATREGLVGALWSLRATAAAVWSTRSASGLEPALAIGASAPRLRLAAALLLSTRSDAISDARAWDGLAGTRYANMAAALAADQFASHGDPNTATERIAALAAGYDLRALPGFPLLPGHRFQQSRRGAAGWHAVYAGWRDRVLAGDSFAHVLAFVPVAAEQPMELSSVLARAVELSADDPAKQLAVARLALAYNQRAWALQLLERLAKTAPSHDVYVQLAAVRAAFGQTAEALSALEAAQDAGADERADLSGVRVELANILALAEQLAVQSTGAERDKAIHTALVWGDRWRAIDPGNAQIDTTLGQLMFAVGDDQGAWRQLSSAIERDPWSSSGYMTVAAMFEQQGRVEPALAYWEMAIRIDQTNPSPRLRKAQALIALGRASEGDAVLAEIVHGKWHDVWESVVYQARELLARGKPSR